MASCKALRNKPLNNRKGEIIVRHVADERLEKFPCLELQELGKYNPYGCGYGTLVHQKQDKHKSIQLLGLPFPIQVPYLEV